MPVRCSRTTIRIRQDFDTFTRDNTDACLLIGQVSERTGASGKAIRHYERVGLLPTPVRRGRYRV
jgi:hypothetical protein